jgi:radical SAM superfamily enzyme YgiQ (UPF0313 family)
MKILLIYPYFLDERIHAYDISVPPIGMYYVGAVLKENGHNVNILNWHSVQSSAKIIKETLAQLRPDVIGFSILHANRWGAIEIAGIAKAMNPAVKIVFGGIGATFLWQHLLTHFRVIDYVVLGEGEYTFLSLVRCFEKNDHEGIKRIRGIAFRRKTGPYRTKPADAIQNLDELPVPADHFEYQHVSFSRGCPGNCTFCGSPQFWGHRVRTHSPQYFVDQLERLFQKGIRSFYFSDDTFTLKKQLVLGICKEIITREMNITWVAISRVNMVDDQILYWMRKAGCTQISYGIESGSEKIRRRFNKRIGTDQIKKAFSSTRSYGILPRAYFIYGAPGETRDTIQETIQLIHEIKPLGAIFYILDIFPGTKLYEDYKKKENVSDDIWLNRVEDIMYFETDPALSTESILEFGNTLRYDFHKNLPRFIDDIELIADKELNRHHADFYSRLGMTFTHGDYAKIDAIADKEALAEKLFLTSLSYFPDHRAYLGLGILYQKQRSFKKSMGILNQGVSHFPNSMDLKICQGINHMNLNNFDEALTIFLEYQTQPQVIPYIIHCYQAKGDSNSAKIFSDKMEVAKLKKK